jgi:hypothetical protein
LPIPIVADDQLQDSLRALRNYTLPPRLDLEDDDESILPEPSLVERLAYLVELGTSGHGYTATPTSARRARIITEAMEAANQEEQATAEKRVAPQGDSLVIGAGVGGTPEIALQKPSMATPNERRIAELQTLLEGASKTGSVEALLDAFPKKLGYLTEGQYATFRTAVRRAMDDSKLRIDVRAVDQIRRESKNRIEWQRALMENADKAVKAGKSVIVISNKQLGDLRAEVVGRLQAANVPPGRIA